MVSENMDSNKAKKILRSRGWSWKRAAEHMGYSYIHVAFMLTGRRPLSAPARERIAALPQSPVPYRNIGFALKSK